METTHLYRHRRKDAADEEFFKRVYEIVAQIPEGKVITYGQIAAMLGDSRAAQKVGWAMANAPAELLLPCHRVVNKSGAMAPGSVFGGTEKQRAMLEQEGITFTPDGCIDMRKHLWQPETKQPSLQEEFNF